MGKQHRRLDAAYGDFAYIVAVRHTAHIMTSKAPSGTSPPVYLYEFGLIKNHSLGTKHSDYSSHTDYLPATIKASATNKCSAASMNSYWTSFVATGDPNKVSGLASSRPE